MDATRHQSDVIIHTKTNSHGRNPNITTNRDGHSSMDMTSDITMHNRNNDDHSSNTHMSHTRKRKIDPHNPSPKRVKQDTNPPNRECKNKTRRIRPRKTGILLRKGKIRRKGPKAPKTAKKQVKIVQWNICGLRSKIAELQLISSEYNPSIIALQETMFDEKKYLHRMDQSKYDWHLKAWDQNSSKNGVALAINKNIPHTEIKLNTNLQALACRTNDGSPTTYVSIYIPPRKMTAKNTKIKLQDLINQLPKPFILLGDINAHHTEWGSFKDDRWGKAILELINENNLKLLNNGSSTKISKNQTSMSAPDLTLASNDFINELTWETDIDTRGSDHFPILMKTDNNSQHKKQKPKWKLDEANWKQFQNDIITKLPIEEEHDINKITNAVYEAASNNIPKTKGIMKKRKVPWWNKEVKTSISNRRKALRKLRACKHNTKKISLVIDLRRSHYTAQKIIKKAKRESWEKFLDSINDDSNLNVLWRKMNRLCGQKKTNETTLVDGDKIITNEKTVAERLASYFYEQSATNNYPKDFIKKKSKQEKIPVKHNFDNNDHKYNERFSLQELLTAITEAKGKAAGIDEISYDIIRKLPGITKIILLEELNRIWAQGKIPTTWKTGIVKPIPKDGANKHIESNYRPITLLSCFGKILEKMVNRRLITELEEKKRLNDNQFAFRPGKSTDDYFSDLEGIINKAKQKDKHIECALLDISKAYDRAWRRPILEKIKEWNIEGNMARYINDFLSNRNFQVEVGSTRSEPKMQENGIPQGATLSVTLFLIAMNSVFDQIHEAIRRKHKRQSINNVKILVYADDIVIIVTGQIKKKLRGKLQKIVDIVVKWAGSVGFTIAPQKSKILHICDLNRHKRSLAKIKIYGEEIPHVQSAKILGVRVDSKMCFKKHITELAKNIRARCYLIKVIGGKYRGANRRTLLRVFNSLVTSKIMYGAHLYFDGNEKKIKPLAALYNQTIRTITGAFRTCSVTDILAEAGILPLVKRLKLNTINKAIRRLESTKDRRILDSPLIKRANAFALELTGKEIPDIAKRHRNTKRKWHAPQPNIDWTIKNSLKAGTHADLATKVFNETFHKYPNHKKVYTDGSVKDDQVGCGITDLQNDESIKLNDMCTIFSAEAQALEHASKLAASTGEETIIFTDSAGCLKALEKGNSKHPWIEGTEEYAKSNKITYCWIPGHAGIKGNEKADKLAEIGRNAQTQVRQVPANDAIRWFKERTIWAHESEWLSNSNSFLRRVKPTSLAWSDRNKTAEQRVLTRVRTGKTWLTHKYQLDKVDRPKCKHCNEWLTADHIIRECRAYNVQRAKYRTESIAIYNNTLESENNLITFLKATNNFYRL